jgi:hypothetical protein
MQDTVHRKFGSHRLPWIAAIYHQPQLIRFRNDDFRYDFRGGGSNTEFIEAPGQL